MLKDIERIKSKVEHILKESPHTRDSDKELLLIYLDTYHDLSNKIGLSNYLKLSRIINDAPGFESIRRTRQRFQEEGKYKGLFRRQRKCEAKKVKKHLQVEKAGKLWY